jgi:hypothetical protein
MVESSARAWQYSGYNYTNVTATARILDSIGSNRTLTPFQDGVKWEGVFNVPVCDIGAHIEWNTQYGDKKEGFGRLPCCCGPNCSDTKAFVEAAGMNGFQQLLSGCKSQLKGSDLNFSMIDYGFNATHHESFKEKWLHWNNGQRFGVVLGFILAQFVVGTMITGCIVAMSE